MLPPVGPGLDGVPQGPLSRYADYAWGSSQALAPVPVRAWRCDVKT